MQRVKLWDLIPINIRRKIEGQRKRKRIEKRLQDEYDREIESHPVIAILGPTGVGKSLTINKLFGTKLRVGHSGSTTRDPTQLKISAKRKNLKGPNGKIVLYDMPGIGEDLEVDEYNKQKYIDVISKSDVAIWVLSAPEWRIAYDQMWLRDIVDYANPEIIDNMVIAINKVDLVHPNNWHEDANLPSREQELYIEERAQDTLAKLIRYCPNLTPDKIVPYSAEKQYHLLHLFSAMLRACPIDRAWVVESRRDIADYQELVTPDLKQQIHMVGHHG